ncbi:putative ubiquitin conjugating enzyme E2 [Cardiosporidium cionae]|uniref:Ubiquitin conjugating enzyme E2 n=1 Tax=Cardiosporidium cionae TaxID=476202 RepID=A0ABQ7J5Q8_9APIC|nr:putative ubiquitin conjugating enzyme E2 [Cardiosporidium cionae]|eukprot:KAF8819269.1 putative ubiquitin conjugating enzyme E2 [Cardiosporidium cionae]
MKERSVVAETPCSVVKKSTTVLRNLLPLPVAVLRNTRCAQGPSTCSNYPAKPCCGTLKVISRDVGSKPSYTRDEEMQPLRSIRGGNKHCIAAILPKHVQRRYKPGQTNYRIQKDLKQFLAHPPMNSTVDVHPNNFRIWIITITGVNGTAYAGEKYRIKITFPEDYPFKPPSLYFLSPAPRHTHIYTNGDICLNLLGSDWKPNLSINSIILAIISMLSSAKEKRLPPDNASLAGMQAGGSQSNFMYHDEKC